MRKAARNTKKLLSFLLTFTIIFSMFSGVVEVQAAAVTDIVFERVKIVKPVDEPGYDLQPGDRLVIYGMGFVNAEVYAGVTGAYPLTVNTSLSTPNKLVIDNAYQLSQIKSDSNIIKVYNNNGAENLTFDGVTDGIEFNLEVIPTLDSLSKNKAYVGQPLDINGSMLDMLDPSNDIIRIAGINYPLVKDLGDTDADKTNADIIGPDKIEIDGLLSPLETGLTDVKIIRKLDGNPKYRIETTLVNSIMVVNEIKNITVDRIDPNSGPINTPNLVNIYVSSGGSNLTPNMRIFVQKTDAQNNIKEVEGTNLGVIQEGGNIVGLSVRLSEKWDETGVVDLVLTTPDRGSELVMADKYTYVTVGNSLSINAINGIVPNFKKETEDKNSVISGRNIGYFTASSYDKVLNVRDRQIIGYTSYKDFPEMSNISSYKVKYTATYDEDGNGEDAGDFDITIIREIWVTIGAEAKIQDDPNNSFTIGSDKIVVKPYNPTINEPLVVDVKIETKTTVFKEDSDSQMTVYYSRSEDATLAKGYTYYPDEIYPYFEHKDITPPYGPNDQDIYMTIKGKDFEVLEDGSEPVVAIGGRIISEDPDTPEQEIMVFDDDNKVVDGKIITTGTKIKFMLPAADDDAVGAVNVTVTNPSGGQFTVYNGFEFRNPNPLDRPEEKMPEITQLKEAYADIRGGAISGETILITGENFDTSATSTPRIIVTIDGEKATVVGKVSSDGKTVTIIPPPGTVPGKTKLQLINEDGSMASFDFEYKLITSNPKITKIVPTKGGKGTKLIIKGEDFVLPDVSAPSDDPKKKGSVVLLGGRELNAYNYDDNGEIIGVAPSGSIYYLGGYDHDGDPDTPDIELDGHMIKVQDITTIYVDIPDSYYSFNAAAPGNLVSTPIAIGQLKVEVLNPDGARSKENVYFNFMDPSTSPVISSITPNSGSVAGGTVVTITGSGFKQDLLEVYFGSEKSTKVEFVNSTIIRATVPKYPYPLPDGQDYLDVPVTVLNYDGGVAVMENGFRYRIPASNPVISSITPNKGSSAGNDRVVIKGLDFRRTPDMDPAGLPKVYFNGREAQVEWPAGNTSTITESLTVTTPPSLTSGPAQVVLVNHDSGTCIYNGFTYIMSQPKINSIMPEKISKFGNVNVQINGIGFREGNLSELFSSAVEKVDRNVASDVHEPAEDAIDVIVAFADKDTGEKRMIDTVLGPMYTEIGDLRFDCTALGGVPEKVRISISRASDSTHTPLSRYYTDENGVKQFDSLAQADITVGSSHLFVINHEMDLDIPNVYDEGILVETTPSSVTITRRIAPRASIGYEGTQLNVVAPPTDKVGSRSLYVINDDGGTAKGTIIIMSPDSNPVITSIDPKNRAKERATGQIVDYIPENVNDYSEVYTFVPLDGGAFLTITGADFRRNVRVYLNDKPLEIVSKSANDDQLVVKVPKGTTADLEKDLRIVVVNEDGGTFDSSMLPQPHYIRYQVQESNPVVESIVPNRSSSRGSNTIAIYGNNFRAGVKVFIEGVEAVTTRDANKPSELLAVLVPTGLEPGKKTVQVLNPDFGFVEVKDGLTIISTPEITAIYDDEGDEINPLVLSVEGGEKIRLEGIQFFPGIRVIFGGTLKPKSQLAAGESGIEGLNINNAEMVIIGGTMASDVQLQPDGSIICTTPKLDMGSTSIIVINADGGVSNQIRGEYQKPVPDTPDGIKVEAVDGDTLRLEWNKVENVNYYELYVLVSENGRTNNGVYEYLGSIIPTDIGDNRLRYYLDGLMSSTWYNIKIRSVNLFGASQFSTSTGFVKTLDEKKVTYYQDENAVVNGIQQKDSAVMNGLELIYTIGQQSIGSSSGSVVNFEQPSYVIADPKIVKISYELLKKYPSSAIRINDRDLELNMKASNLAVPETTRVAESLRSDMDLRVTIDRTLGIEGDDIRIKLPRGYRIMMNPFSINLNLQVQNTSSRIASFNGNIGLLLKYAESKRSLYPGGVFIAYYDRTTGKLQIVNTQELSGKAQSQISKTGEYVLIGKMVQ